MQLGPIAQIKVPEGRKYKLEEAVLMKVIEKEQTFCEVKLIKYEGTGYTLKIIHKDDIPKESYEEQYQRVYNEINALYTLNHPNVIKLFYHEENQKDILMLQEYGGTRLWGLLRRQQLSQEQIRDIVIQLLHGLKEIHDNGFIHRDLSSENILVSKDRQIKIIDLGYVDEVRGRHTKLGTLFYMAPQITGEDGYNHKVDIWSLGITTYQMFHQDIPFCSRSDFDQITFVQNRDKLKLHFKQGLSTDATDFLLRMLVIDPEKRDSVDQLLKHPFIKQGQPSEEPLESDFFDRLNQTEKIERKTQKNNLYLRDKSDKISEGEQQEKGIRFEQRQLKQSINEMFACLHHQKDVFGDLIKTYQDILQKEAIAKAKKS